MGIRYYAYPVDADDIDDARANPFNYLGVDPLMDAWGPEAERPEMLYLDKSWRDLQHLLATPPAHPSRPAAALVAGDVVNTPEGWIPHVEVLSPAQILDVARDLDTVTESEICTTVRSRTMLYASEEEEISFLRQFLRDAQEFAVRLSKDGRGAIYLIG